jgi:8-oxo-dGTP pyrophosphatase MutT (NUDIX family)
MDYNRIRNILQQEHTLHEYEWKGAVLFLCNDEHVFLIKRSEKMPTHGGQMAFVGGHRQVNELNPWIVSQREFEEETSVSASHLEFLGYLPVVLTTRLSSIVPVMARLLISTDDFLKIAKSNGEWDQILAYPWTSLMVEQNWDFAWRSGYSQGPILFHPIRSYSYLHSESNEKSHLLWGATASMVWDFLRLYFKV